MSSQVSTSYGENSEATLSSGEIMGDIDRPLACHSGKIVNVIDDDMEQRIVSRAVAQACAAIRSKSDWWPSSSIMRLDSEASKSASRLDSVESRFEELVNLYETMMQAVQGGSGRPDPTVVLGMERLNALEDRIEEISRRVDTDVAVALNGKQPVGTTSSTTTAPPATSSNGPSPATVALMMKRLAESMVSLENSIGGLRAMVMETKAASDNSVSKRDLNNLLEEVRRQMSSLQAKSEDLQARFEHEVKRSLALAEDCSQKVSEVWQGMSLERQSRREEHRAFVDRVEGGLARLLQQQEQPRSIAAQQLVHQLTQHAAVEHHQPQQQHQHAQQQQQQQQQNAVVTGPMGTSTVTRVVMGPSSLDMTMTAPTQCLNGQPHQQHVVASPALGGYRSPLCGSPLVSDARVVVQSPLPSGQQVQQMAPMGHLSPQHPLQRSVRSIGASSPALPARPQQLPPHRILQQSQSQQQLQQQQSLPHQQGSVQLPAQSPVQPPRSLSATPSCQQHPQPQPPQQPQQPQQHPGRLSARHEALVSKMESGLQSLIEKLGRTRMENDLLAMESGEHGNDPATLNMSVGATSSGGVGSAGLVKSASAPWLPGSQLAPTTQLTPSMLPGSTAGSVQAPTATPLQTSGLPRRSLSFSPGQEGQGGPGAPSAPYPTRDTMRDSMGDSMQDSSRDSMPESVGSTLGPLRLLCSRRADVQHSAGRSGSAPPPQTGCSQPTSYAVVADKLGAQHHQQQQQQSIVSGLLQMQAEMLPYM